MDLYRLNSFLQNDLLIEGYESAIWTERFHEAGELEILFPLTPEFVDSLPVGTYVGCSRSDRVMRIDTREFTRDEDGRRFLKVSGESLEATLKHRIAWGSIAGSSMNHQFVMEGPVKNIIERMIRRAGFGSTGSDPALDPATDLTAPGWGDPKATFNSAGYPENTLPEPGDAVIAKDKPMSTYDYILELCRMYNVGYRMVRKPGTSATFAILINVYQGLDLTSGQTTSDPVVFSTLNDNLENESMIHSIREQYNGVWVWDDHATYPGRTGVYLPDYGPDPSVQGLDLKLAILTTSHLAESDTAGRSEHRRQRGEEFLYEHGDKLLVDGEISRNSQYVYGVHYRLGDRVEVETQFNYSSYMRVTEQIFISDEAGVKSYPTLTAETVVGQDSWMAQPTNRTWNSALGEWENE